MRINKLNPENNSSKIKELTIYRVLTNPKTNNDINNEDLSCFNKSKNK